MNVKLKVTGAQLGYSTNSFFITMPQIQQKLTFDFKKASFTWLVVAMLV